MRYRHKLSINLLALCLLIIGLMTGAPALAADKGEPKKASFDAVPASKSPILQFRSVGVGIYPAHSLELDFYLASKWAVGASLFGESRYCWNSESRCRQTTGLGAHAERFFGGRWAHLGLRAGVYATTYYVQHPSIFDGTPVARSGGLFGPQLGLTATFTPTRWTGITVALIGMPGFFEGFKTREYADYDFDENEGDPTRELLFTGMLTVGVRFGVLDGPSRLCPCCQDASIPCGE